ncbi:MAG: hypothetical protein OHK0032_08930 [Thermodesulfovibrionales bacterium]
MSKGVKSGLTLPWLWVAIIIAYLALGFMLPPFDAPMKELGKTKVQVEPAPDQKEKGEIVFQ